MKLVENKAYSRDASGYAMHLKIPLMDKDPDRGGLIPFLEKPSQYSFHIFFLKIMIKNILE